MDPIEKVINSSIASLSLSDNFKKATLEHGHYTLNGIMNMPVTELAAMKWFTREMLEELAEFMLHIRNGQSIT
jgi:hypothetical protein